jgi:8-oxo-dGTP pyrophosphatase MutT (NUDIX family)
LNPETSLDRPDARVPTAAWLRQRLAGPQRLQPVEEEAIPQGLIPAAVLVPIVERPHGLTVLLTQRSAHLHDHANQVSFPGGRCEETDLSPVFTALRETEEEIGLDPASVEVIGQLPEYRTATGFSVTPVVGLVRPPFELKPDRFEVAAVFETPLAFLLDPANRQRRRMEVGGVVRHYYAMSYEGYFIWGATAGMLVSLQRLLGGD